MKDSFLKNAAEVLSLPLDKVEALSLEEQDAHYASAYAFYETGNYEQASDFFTCLVLSDPFIEKYWRGLAASRQMEKKYLEALHAWCLSALLDDEDPMPHFHAAECLFMMQDKEEAHKALMCAEERLKNECKFSHLRCKIELLKQVHLTM